VEIWRTPGTWYYTYPKGPPGASDVRPVQPDRSVSRYTSALVDTRDGNPTVQGVNGVNGAMTWTVTYTIEAGRFTVETELAADHDIELAGDLGGLLLLTNPACQLYGNFGDCRDMGALSSRTLHRVETPARSDLLWDSPIQPATDQQRELKGSSASWELGADASAHNLIMSPWWSVTDPQGQSYTPKAAFHYNSTATDIGGLNGLGSLDVVLEAPAGGTIALGPTRGVVDFGAELTHRSGLSAAVSADSRRAQAGVLSWATARWCRLLW
jgi:hypothetical protein